jgi:ABC-2 type transport system permease protein
VLLLNRFPELIQPFIQVLPLMAVVDALRANILRGAGGAALAPEVGVIVAWMLGSFILALKLFRWR